MDTPQQIGRYEVRHVVGRGGMAVVLEAWDPVLHRLLAVKLVDKTSFEGGRFDGFVQVIRYPAGTSECIVPLHAESSQEIGGGIGIGLRIRGIRVPITGAMPKEDPQKQVEEDFQGHFWQAAEAALSK